MKATICLALVLVGGVVAARQSTPTFRTGVNAVVVDARVVDRAGRFISDLTRDDFRVFEDGEERTLSTFELVEVPREPSTDFSPAAFLGPASDTASNINAALGRLYVIVLDDLTGNTQVPGVGRDITSNQSGRVSHFGSSSPLVGRLPPPPIPAESLAREVIFHMSEHDRAAVVSTSGRRDLAQEFTGDRQRLIATVDRYVANQGPGTQFGKNSVLDALETLTDVANWLSGIPGRRKAIILVSQRLAGMTFNLSLSNRSRNAGRADLLLAHYVRDVVEATARSNTSIYALSPALGETRTIRLPLADEYVLAMTDDDPRSKVVSLAQATGGFSRAVDFNDVFERIASENAAYYLIGFQSPNSKNDGKFHRIEVRTERPGLAVRTRAGYIAKAGPELKKGMVPGSMPTPLIQALQSPSPVADFPLSMTAVPYRGDGSKAALSILVDAGSDRLSSGETRSDSRPIELVIAAAQADGEVHDLRRITVTGGLVTSRLAVKPGHYHVRVAALDTGDQRTGSVISDIDVPDFRKGRLTMSGISLTSTGARQSPVAGVDTSWKESFGVPPTTRRSFTVGEDLRDFVEVYQNGKPMPEILVRTTVTRTTGETVFSQEERSAVGFTRGAPVHRVVTTVPTAGLSPGTFVLRIEAAQAGSNGEAVARQIPFSLEASR